MPTWNVWAMSIKLCVVVYIPDILEPFPWWLGGTYSSSPSSLLDGDGRWRQVRTLSPGSMLVSTLVFNHHKHRVWCAGVWMCVVCFIHSLNSQQAPIYFMAVVWKHRVDIYISIYQHSTKPQYLEQENVMIGMSVLIESSQDNTDPVCHW